MSGFGYYYDPEHLTDFFDLKGKNGRKPKPTGEELNACCPFPHYKNGQEYFERNPSFSINLTNGYYNCYSCGKGGRNLESLSWRLGKDSLHYFPKIIGQIKKVENDDEKAFLHDHLIIALSRNPAVAKGYFESRGWEIDHDFIETYSVGANLSGTVVYCPVRGLRGHLLGWAERRANLEPRWLNQPGDVFQKNETLYGAYEFEKNALNKWLIVVESISDVLRLAAAGYSAVATMGANISETQIELMLYLSDQICVLPQEDDPGYRWFGKLVNLLHGRCALYGARISSHKDSGEVKENSIIHRAFENRKLIKHTLKEV